jgi:cell division protein ZipA
MNELRWILLIAGALLIAGIYMWGLRSRSRRAPVEDAGRRPAVFTGGATGFESESPTVVDEDPLEEPAIVRDGRRLEPSVSLDEDDLDAQRPAIERRGGLESVEADAPPGGPAARREPTFGVRVEPVMTSGRTEPTVGARLEPPLANPEPTPAADPPAPPQAVRAPADPAATRPVTEPAPTSASEAPPARSKRPQRIFAVRVSATGTERFGGQRVLDALHSEGLRFGRYDIFHCLHGDGRPVFSVASLRDPGTFDPQTMAETQYPGILVFTVLPGPVGAGEAFDEMLFTARALATHLEASLSDDRGVPLTAHRAGRLREEALEFERSLHAA